MRISDWSSDVCSSDLGNAIRKVDRPLHDLHAPERSTDHGGPAPDAEHVGQQRLRAHPVAHRQQWKIRAVRLAGAFVDAARPRGPAAAAEIVQCDDVETIGNTRLTRAEDRTSVV